MCCLAEFIVKYVLIISNFIFAIAGLAIIGLGTAAQINLNEIHDVVPGSLSFLTISIITLGCIIFVIAFCACCGAIRESTCMLLTYAVFMGILAAVKIYITVVIFEFLGHVTDTVTDWLTKAFANSNVRPAYNAMENLFKCCGTVGPASYPTIGLPVSPTCCKNPDMLVNECSLTNSYEGCIPQVTSYLESFGEAIGIVLIVVILVECVCLIFSIFLVCQFRNKKRRYA
ncbi:hypothetical protein PYW07_011278 [Mythimna separata]|uniref:Tetraspanin n=1 Tax=Mythimna separata TaxID=271217 RepID=A0AAD7Y936_MYTSE|nr:hypothetical protein PYW07_011278 [Mythimna separata]